MTERSAHSPDDNIHDNIVPCSSDWPGLPPIGSGTLAMIVPVRANMTITDDYFSHFDFAKLLGNRPAESDGIVVCLPKSSTVGKARPMSNFDGLGVHELLELVPYLAVFVAASRLGSAAACLATACCWLFFRWLAAAWRSACSMRLLRIGASPASTCNFSRINGSRSRRSCWRPLSKRCRESSTHVTRSRVDQPA